jgi:hypothetical protein
MALRSVSLALALGLTAVAAQAQEAPQVAEFKVADVPLKIELPAGFCPLTGPAAERAQKAAASDTANETLVTAFPCPKSAVDAAGSIQVKAPKAMSALNVARPTLLASLGAPFENPEFAKAVAAGSPSKSATVAFGKQLEGGPATQPVGRDEVCGYVAGKSSITTNTAQARTVRTTVAGCMTSVKGKVVLITLAGPANGSAEAQVLQLRALAAALVAKNEAP